jgi:hypothetical protein
VKCEADLFDRSGGDPLAFLREFASAEHANSQQRQLAIRALRDLDSGAQLAVANEKEKLQSIIVELPVFTRLSEQPQADPFKKWIIGLLVTLAILWPAHSVYRFNHPRPVTRKAADDRAREPPATDFSRRISGTNWVGCLDRDFFKQLVGFAAVKDNEAFARSLNAGLQLGACTRFQPGEVVFLEEAGIFSGLVRIRRKGETSAYWTNTEAIRE